jgi:hypothetical protein
VIDGARGTAMVFVFLAHFIEACARAFPNRGHAFNVVTRVASPAFVWISGVTLAVLYAKSADWFKRTRDKLIDRALFLLLVCHPVIVGAYLMKVPTWHDALRVVFITDTVAVCLIVGVLAMPRLASRPRAALGVALMLASWILMVLWNPPVNGWAWRVKDTLVGDWRDHWATYNFTPVPWMGFYLIASAAGAWFVRSRDAGQQRRVRWLAAAVGIGGIAAAQALEVGGRAVAHLSAVRGYEAPLALLASAEKVPPTPGYFLRYGGLALLLFALVLAASDTIRGQRLLRWASLFGRCSVATFVLQYYVYCGLVQHLPAPAARWLPLHFAWTVVLIWLVVRAWERANGNRLITVGYPGFVRRLRRRRQNDERAPDAGASAA